MKCLQCGETEIVEGVRAVDRGDQHMTLDFVLQVYTNPSALIFKGGKSFPVSGNVCTNCGFVMFSVSVDDAKRIKAHREKSG